MPNKLVYLTTNPHKVQEAKGEKGRWHDKFYIPDGEEKTLSELRAINHEYEAQFWGHPLDDFAKWYKEKLERK